MTTIRRVILFLTLCGTPWIGLTAHAGEPRHPRSNELQQVGVERAINKWETDGVVRQGMENIRQALAANQADIQQDRLDPRAYQQLAEVINSNVAYIIKECKLARAADAALHTVVLTDLTGSSELMRTSPKRAAQRVGALGVLQSLRLYGEYFEHPGWVMVQAR